MGIRTGLGWDIHPLVEGRKFVLGGVVFDFEKGEAGHSDGDVLVHAVIDALAGAAGLGDIGELFPPDDPALEGIDSMILLKKTCSLIKEAGWKIINLDCVVKCERPHILPAREKIRASLAGAMEIKTEQVFLKGKSGEGLGDIGKGLAAEALAICLLENTK